MSDCPTCGLPPAIIKVHRKLRAKMAESDERVRVLRKELADARRVICKQEKVAERQARRLEQSQVRAQSAEFERRAARQQVQQCNRQAGALRQQLHANEARTDELVQQVEQFKQVFRGLRALMPKGER